MRVYHIQIVRIQCRVELYQQIQINTFNKLIVNNTSNTKINYSNKVNNNHKS
jgi:hypothetical protein